MSEKEKLYSELLSNEGLLSDERKRFQENLNEKQIEIHRLQDDNSKLQREIQELKMSKESVEYKYVSGRFLFFTLFIFLL